MIIDKMDTNSFNIQGLFLSVWIFLIPIQLNSYLPPMVNYKIKIIKGGELQGNVDISFDSKVWV